MRPSKSQPSASSIIGLYVSRRCSPFFRLSVTSFTALLWLDAREWSTYTQRFGKRGIAGVNMAFVGSWNSDRDVAVIDQTPSGSARKASNARIYPLLTASEY